MNATDLAALVAWVRAGDERDLPPRIDQAAELCAAFPHTPKPDWWLEPDQCGNPANYWPMIGGGMYRTITGWGESAEYSGAEEERVPDPPMDTLISRSRVTWKDILDSTYSGDTIASIALRLGLNRSSLCQRLRNNPGIAARIDEKRGAIRLGRARAGREVMA